MKTIAIIFAAMAMAVSYSVAADTPGVTQPDAEVKKLAEDFKFTEGPAVDQKGNVYFTDQPNDRIMKWDAEKEEISTFMQPSGRSNGMYFDAEGNLISCADEKCEMWKIKPDGSHEVLFSSFQDKMLNGPNDLWIHPNGDYYFTDPFYKRPWWDHNEPPQGGQHVYRYDIETKEISRIADDLVQPNGIIGTPDGKTLYVADIGDKKTYSFTIQEDGSLADRKLFCEQGSDGMTIDNQGNVYLTGKGVSVYNKNGEKIEQIDVPENWTANVTIGGPERNILYITSSKGFYGVPLKTKAAF